MNFFVLGYYTLLIGTSCAAAYYNQRKVFLLLFTLTLASFLMGIIGGVSALTFIAYFALILALAAGTSYAFREFLIYVVPQNIAKEIRTAPLTAVFGMFVICVYAIAGIFAPVIAPYGQTEVVTTAFAPPDENLLLGADQIGRDMFSRIVFGARNSVGLALISTVLAFILGAIAGLVAATKGGWTDQILGRVADVIISIPSLIFALLMLSVLTQLFESDYILVELINQYFNSKILIIIIVVALIYSPRVFRLTRAVAGNIVVMDYVEAAKLRGEGMWYLIRKEILPNSIAPLIAEFGLEFCFVFLLIAGLSFLGLGLDSKFADWGTMVRDNATLISFGDLTPLIPAAAIALLTVAVNFVVDWMLYRSSGLKGTGK